MEKWAHECVKEKRDDEMRSGGRREKKARQSLSEKEGQAKGGVSGTEYHEF